MVTATIKDVAREAAVSVASVSRALNGGRGVSSETGQRIREVAKRLRYVPHAAARTLITRRTNTIGALLPDLYGEFFSELIRGIDLAARSCGLHLLVSSSHDNADDVAAALRAPQERVEGLVLMSPHADAEFLQKNPPVSVPTVLMNTGVDGDEYEALSVDNNGGARLMVEHLLEQGHRRIVFFRGPVGNRDAAERELGYHQALHNLASDSAVIFLPGDFSEASGYSAGAANDMMAIGCMTSLREEGLRVADDIASGGFDDVPMARYVSPPLTTIQIRIAELGGQEMQMLGDQLDNPDADEVFKHHCIAAELVIHAFSSKPPG